jgi:hypothetical protein
MESYDLHLAHVLPMIIQVGEKQHKSLQLHWLLLPREMHKGYCGLLKKSQESRIPLTSDKMLLAGILLHSQEAEARDNAIWHQGCNKTPLATGG